MAKPKVFKIDLSEQFSHLESSPLVEAVIHWSARAETPLEEESLQQMLRQRLPQYPKVSILRWRTIKAVLAANGSARQSQDEGWEGVRLASADDLFVVQFRKDGLVFSRLAPYHNWEDFSEAALTLWKLYCELAHPLEVQRLGTRFINRIPIHDMAQVRRYLLQPPKCLERMGLPSEHFMYHSAHRVPDEPYGIDMTRTVPPPELMADRTLALIVDIDAFTRTPFGTAEEESRHHLARLRWLKNKAFFSVITPRAVKEFSRPRSSR
jgi:uncharacterized protein (TIGR04255 family)